MWTVLYLIGFERPYSMAECDDRTGIIVQLFHFENSLSPQTIGLAFASITYTNPHESRVRACGMMRYGSTIAIAFH
jgi:hypothetical protein